MLDNLKQTVGILIERNTYLPTTTKKVLLSMIIDQNPLIRERNMKIVLKIRKWVF